MQVKQKDTNMCKSTIPCIRYYAHIYKLKAHSLGIPNA